MIFVKFLFFFFLALPDNFKNITFGLSPSIYMGTIFFCAIHSLNIFHIWLQRHIFFYMFKIFSTKYTSEEILVHDLFKYDCFTIFLTCYLLKFVYNQSTLNCTGNWAIEQKKTFVEFIKLSKKKQNTVVVGIINVWFFRERNRSNSENSGN